MTSTLDQPDENPPLNIHFLPITYLPTLPPQAEPYEFHRNAHTPIIIDNGSTTLRWGFGSSSNPNEEPTPFIGPNAVAKYRDRKTNKPLLLFGEAIDSESGARGQAKTPWEGDVLLNFDALVSVYGFYSRTELRPDGSLPGGIGKCPGLRLHTTGD